MKLALCRTHYFILFVAFILSVLFRLPNLDRPLSKHHEFNTAVILNGIISWKEGGGAARFGYLPIMNYQGADNQILQQGPHTDGKGNQLYLSLGAGWYVLPYLVFTGLHLPFTPLSLQLLNLCIHLLTLLAMYRLGRVITAQYSLLSPHFPLYLALVFLFLPGPLWFYGNGYVHDAVSLPFAISLFSLFVQFLFRQAKMNGTNLAFFVLFGFAGIYFDWFTFFLLATIGCCSFYLFIKKKGKRWFLFSLFCGGVAIAAVGLVFWQFAHFLSVQQVVEYWTNRAGARTVVDETQFFPFNGIAFFKNIATCAGIAVFCVGLAFFSFKKKNFPTLPLLLWLATCIGYNGIFFNWSYSHEFSMVPLCVGISIAAAYFIQQVQLRRMAGVALALLCMFNVVHYYFINPPGKFAQIGTPYNQQQLLGQDISNLIPHGVRIFSNFHNDPLVEYYAHRSFTLNRAATLAIAKHICDSLGIPKATWIRVDSMQIKEVYFIR